MARTYRNNNGDKKVIRGFVAGFLSDPYHKDGRGQKRLKNGILECESENTMKYLHGHYGVGVPKSFRKTLVRQKRTQLKQELRNAFCNDRLDEVEKSVVKRNAGYYYY